MASDSKIINYRITRIVLNANSTCSFYDGSTMVWTYKTVKEIKRDRPLGQYIVITDDYGTVRSFDCWSMLDLNGKPYTPLNIQSPGINQLYQDRIDDIFKILTINIFKGCCDCGGGEESACGIQYQWSSDASDVQSGQFSFGFSGLLVMSPTSYLSQDLSGVLDGLPEGSRITFTGVESPGSNFVVFELSSGGLYSGLVMYMATVLSGSVFSFTDEQIFCVQIDTGGSGSGTTFIEGSDTVDITGDGSSGNPYVPEVIDQMSITDDAFGIKLVNDQLTPTQQFHYGTDEAGAKGWKQNFVTIGTVLSNIYNPISSPQPSITTGFQNTVYGIGIMPGLTTGNRNSVFGASLTALVTGNSNTVFGYGNMLILTTNEFNSVFGTLNLNNNGYGNAILGYGNMNNTPNPSSSSYNVIVGDGCLLVVTGWENIALGITVLPILTSGARNIAIGYQAGASITTGSKNILIGEGADGAATASDQIVLGRGVVAAGTGFWVGFIQNASGPQALYYDPATKQITYDTVGGGGNFIPYDPSLQTADIGSGTGGEYSVDPTNGEIHTVTTVDFITKFIIIDGGIEIRVEDLNTGEISTLVSQSGKISMSLDDGVSATSVAIENQQALVSSTDPAFPGAQYDVDYSANYTDRSLPDVGYVNSAIASAFPWVEETASITLVANRGVVANDTSVVNLALPTTAAQFTIIEVTGIGSGGWRITQAAGQSIQVGVTSTTVGAGGTLTGANIGDGIRMICTVADTTWQALSTMGNLTTA